VYTLRSFVGNNNLVFNRTRATLYVYHKQSPRDFLPPKGIYLNAEAFNTVGNSNLNGSQFSGYLHAYLPGFDRHHSLNGYMAFQGTLFTNNFLTNYIFENRVPVPRGQSVFRSQNFFSASVNYALPLLYPDLALGPLLNIQRVRANLFFDYGFGNSPINRINQSYSTVGIEYTFDVNVMRFLPQLDLGFRISKGLSPATTTFEFLLGTINF
jgi:hypothetical protein